MLVCGEPSGDQLGAQLMAGLRHLAGDGIRIVGVGGAAMAREGLESLFPLDATAVMGLREVVPAIPAILRRVREAADFALATQPDAVVLIDSPDFTHRIARASRSAIPPSAPSIMSRRRSGPVAPIAPGAMARYFDLVLALFPFEVPFFERHGLKAAFVGPSGDRAGRPHDGRRRLARAARHRCGCAAAGAPAGQPHAAKSGFILPHFRDAVALLARESSRPGHRPAHRAACRGRSAPGNARIGRRHCISCSTAKPTNSPPSTPPMWRWRRPAR